MTALTARLRSSTLRVIVVLALLAVGVVVTGPPASAAPSQPDFGLNVSVFDPSMPQSEIQTTVDAIAAQQVPNQFGSQRYALLFKPGTYGTPTNPLNFQVGYYTEVAGLGASPGDVVINGSVYVRNQCSNGSCVALNNFWRSLSNLTINVTTPGFGCYSGEFWPVSQAAPMRRVHINGPTTMMDYCTPPSFASGGFIADSRFDGNIVNGSQQQFFVRNTTLNGWSNGVWNQVFAGTNGAPAQCFPAQASCGPYTTLATTPANREKPYLYVDGTGNYQVFVPAATTNSVGESWAAGATPGRSIPLSRFYIAKPSDSVQTLNNQLAQGQNLLLTPGTYNVDRTIKVKRADTVVLGLGFATLTPANGDVAMTVADVPGVDIAGLIFDAGPVNSPTLLQIGTQHASNGAARENNGWSNPADPTGVQDVFFRIGGPHVGKAAVSLQVNADNVILDDIWAWRADHGNGVGWLINTADTGVVVNGENVTATGLFVEHYQKFQVIWNGSNGTDVFFQSEMPYDVPGQEAWMSSPTTDGYAAVLISPTAQHFTGYGMGTYSFFNQGKDIFAAHAYEAPTPANVQMHDLLTIFLDASAGKGGILNVINDTGGPSTIANPDVPVTVTSYP
jgi:hypothetical protein